jgi:hypothetical protein
MGKSSVNGQCSIAMSNNQKGICFFLGYRRTSTSPPLTFSVVSDVREAKCKPLRDFKAPPSKVKESTCQSLQELHPTLQMKKNDTALVPYSVL